MSRENRKLEIYNEQLKRYVENTFALRSKHPNRHFVVSRDPRYPFRIIEDGKDITPLPYDFPGMTFKDNKEMNDSWKKVLDLAWEVFNRPEDTTITIDEEEFMNAFTGIGLIERLDVWHSPKEIKKWEKERLLKRVPSMYRLREDPPIIVNQTEFPTVLQETPTFLLLDVVSYLAPVTSEEATRYKEDNERHLDREIKKKFMVIDPNREEFTQNFGGITRNESTLIRAPTRDNASVDVNDYDRIRTFIDLGIVDGYSRKESKLTSITIIKTRPNQKKWKPISYQMFERKKETPKELEWLESLDFLKLAGTVERILIANIFSNLQFMYHERLYSSKPVDDFQYIPQLLWTCSCPRTYGKAVTCISWSSINTEIFVVSYGKYLFETKMKNGLVCVWNVKNTEFPERMSILPAPVTFVEFSKKYPRIAGVSFWDGTVGLLDLVLKEPELLVKSDFTIGLLFPIWQIRWFECDGDEVLLTCGANGEIHTFEPTRKFQSRKIITLQRVGNAVGKGIRMPQINPNYDRCGFSPSVMVMAQYPKDEKILFLGADNGYVYIYSLYKQSEPLDVFGAHTGPITAIEFNPVESRIFLTAGCDFHIRIWGYNIYETCLLTLHYRCLYVDYAVWCPAHPYMIVSLSGIYLDVWNLKKKFYEPISSIENPYQNKNLVVSFNPTGANFLVGDMKGYVFVYSFTSIPKPPEDPLKKFVEAIMFPLSHDEERLKLIALKLGPPFLSDEKKINELFSEKKK